MDNFWIQNIVYFAFLDDKNPPRSTQKQTRPDGLKKPSTLFRDFSGARKTT
jgi:hypothetical protein